MATTVLSTIDNEAITGAFALAVDVSFNDLSAGNSQDVFEFSNAEGTSRIWFGQLEGTNDVEFGIEQDGVIHTVVATNVITEGEYATWRVGVDPDGTMRIAKNYDLLVEGDGVVPSDEPRESRLIGSSQDPDDTDLDGVVLNLKIANYGNVTELDPTFQASPCATTGEVRCFCDKLRPDGPVEPGIEGETQISATDLEGDGEWSAVQSLGLIPIHAMVLPDGKVLSFGTDENGTQTGQFVYSLYDPETGVDIILPNTTDTDIFCSNMSIDPVTGNVLLMGGDARGEGGQVNTGINDVLVFDYATQTIRDATQGEMAYDRWYNTSVTLSNGEIMTLGGTGGGKDNPEIYNPDTGWRELTGVEMNINYYYPKTWVTSDDKVFVFPGGGQMYRIDPTGDGSAENLGWPGFPRNAFQPGVMYDVDKVAIVGTDNMIYIADISAEQPVFTAVAQLDHPRQEGGMSMLPDGRVIITGGAPSRYDLENASYTAEIWDPRDNSVEEVADAALARLYHSTHLLLPNGMIWAGGGGAPGPLTNTNVEIYAPSYLYDENGDMADRPRIVDAPTNVENDETFEIKVEDTADIARVTAVRTGALTHAVNSDQRFVELDFTVVDGNTLQVTSLSDGAMVPGSWMLFVLDDNGVPSVASMLGVAMADLIETPNLVPADTGLDVYGIDDDDIDGAFEITVEARFDDIDGGSYQRVFDFGNGAGQDNIVLGQINRTPDMFFSVFVDGVQYTIIAPNAIEEGVVAKWTTSIDASGYMRLWKDDVLVAEGQGAVPADVDRALKLVGESNWAADDRLEGMVRYLETVNEGDAPEYLHFGQPRISLIAPEDALEGDSGETGVIQFEVRLDQPAAAIVTADVSVVGGVGPAQVIIPAGQTSAFIDVAYNGNNDFGLDQQVVVSLSNVSQARIASDLSVSATIIDDDSSGTYLKANYFLTNGATSLADVDFDTTPIQEDIVSEISENAGDGAFYPGGPTDSFAVRYEGGFWVDTAGEHTFFLGSDDGSALFIDGVQVIDNDGIHGLITLNATVDLAAGQHQIEVRYFENLGGAAIDLEWAGPGFTRTQMDFTAAQPPAEPPAVDADVSGRYFVDLDGSSTLTAGDDVVAGATVRLIRNGVEMARTTTDAEGRYSFADVEAGGGYRVAFEDPNDSLGQDLDYITDRVGGDALTDSDVIWSDGFGDGTTRKFSVEDGTPQLGIDAGLRGSDVPPDPDPEPEPEPEPGDTGLEGRYFIDLDGSGTYTEGDTDVAGARVSLVRNGTAVDQTVTRADGTYSFTGIEGGSGYRIAFENPTGAVGQAIPYITERIGGDDLIDSDVIWTDGRGDGITRKVTVSEGFVLSGIDAGLQGSEFNPNPDPDPEPTGDASVSGRYFIDRDGDQVLNTGDDTIEGATVWLIRDGATIAQTTTGADGSYVFNGIEPGGGYRLAFENPPAAIGEELTYITTRVGDAETDSDVIWSNNVGDGTTYKFSLTDGTELTGMNAGLDGSVTDTPFV